MELKVDMPSLAGQDIDPAAFQRVWNRVMPGQPAPSVPSARNDSTSSGTDDTVPPSEPPAAPEETPPVEEQPGNPPSELPPVPDCPVQSQVPECPAQPSVPDCPSCPDCPTCPECPPCQECPACPECPTCPDCPACQECPTCPDCPACSECPACPDCPAGSGQPGEPPLTEQPALCLGEASQGDSGQLEELMTLARAGAVTAQTLTRRSSGSCAKTLSALACDHRMAFRRLSAAYFLITGKRYNPKCPEIKLPLPLPLALRQQFVWEQQWERRNKQAAQDTSDACLKELYLELAQEGAFHAGSIRSLLEQMA